MAMTLEHTTLDLSLDVCRERAGETREAPCAASQEKQAQERREDQQEAREGVGSMRVLTNRFGLLEVDPELTLTFPEGLIGFEQCSRYIVVRHQENSAFRWLQSLEEAHVAFPIIEPGEFCARYAPTISDADARFLELNGEAPILLFTIVTIPPSNPHAMTANLLGPLVINGLTRRGKQVIAQDEGLTTRHKIMEELARREQGTEAAARQETAQARDIQPTALVTRGTRLKGRAA